MDRGRYRNRARELQACAELVGKLTQMPDRASQKDFQQAAKLMEGAASDLEELVTAQPAGCSCRRIRDDNYDYLDYHEGCLHHRQLYLMREALKADYAKMEKALKSEVRMKLVAAALTGTATPMDHRDLPIAGIEPVVARAIAIADEAIRTITADGRSL